MNKSFKCKRCAKCCLCLTVLLSKNDINRIKKKGYEEAFFIDTENIGPYKGKSSLKRKNNRCIFLAKKNKKYYCKIYDIRPKTCKDYPAGDCGPFSSFKPKSF